MPAHCKVCGYPIYSEGQCYGVVHPPGSGIWVCEENTCRARAGLPLLPGSGTRVCRGIRQTPKEAWPGRERFLRGLLSPEARSISDSKEKEMQNMYRREDEGYLDKSLREEVRINEHNRHRDCVTMTARIIALERRIVELELSNNEPTLAKCNFMNPCTHHCNHPSIKAMNWLEYNASVVSVDGDDRFPPVLLWCRGKGSLLRDAILSEHERRKQNTTAWLDRAVQEDYEDAKS